MYRAKLLIIILLLETLSVPLLACTKKVFLSVNKPLKDQLRNSSAIYVVKFSFDLKGDTLFFPKGAHISFEGGTLKNGVLYGDNTIIRASKTQIFSNVVISGTWNNKVVYGDWFDFDVSGKYDNLQNFRNLMILCAGDNTTQLYLSEGLYCVSQVNNSAPIVVPSNVYWHNSATIQLQPSDYTHYAIVSIKQVNNVVIDGGMFIGDLKTHWGTKGEWGHGIKVEGSSNVTIKNLQTRECWGDGIDLVEGEYVSSLKVGVGNCNRVTIDNVKSLYNRRQGLSIEAAENVVVKNSEFAYTGEYGFTEPGCGVDIEPWCKNEKKIDNILFLNCSFHDNSPIRDFCIQSNQLYYKANLIEQEPTNRIKLKDCTIGNLYIRWANSVTVTRCVIDGISQYEYGKNVNMSRCIIKGRSGIKKTDGLTMRRCVE